MSRAGLKAQKEADRLRKHIIKEVEIANKAIMVEKGMLSECAPKPEKMRLTNKVRRGRAIQLLLYAENILVDGTLKDAALLTKAALCIMKNKKPKKQVRKAQQAVEKRASVVRAKKASEK